MEITKMKTNKLFLASLIATLILGGIALIFSWKYFDATEMVTKLQDQVKKEELQKEELRQEISRIRNLDTANWKLTDKWEVEKKKLEDEISRKETVIQELKKELESEKAKVCPENNSKELANMSLALRQTQDKLKVEQSTVLGLNQRVTALELQLTNAYARVSELEAEIVNLNFIYDGSLDKVSLLTNSLEQCELNLSK